MPLSKYSPTAYYKYTLENEESARRVAFKLLTLAGECRHPLNNATHLDFLLVSPLRRKLVHGISRDFGLLCSSIYGKYGKFQRVSSLVHEVD